MPLLEKKCPCTTPICGLEDPKYYQDQLRTGLAITRLKKIIFLDRCFKICAKDDKKGISHNSDLCKGRRPLPLPVESSVPLKTAVIYVYEKNHEREARDLQLGAGSLGEF